MSSALCDPGTSNLLKSELLSDLPSPEATAELLAMFFDPYGPAGPSGRMFTLYYTTESVIYWRHRYCPSAYLHETSKCIITSIDKSLKESSE